jgi:hypothetical protein
MEARVAERLGAGAARTARARKVAPRRIVPSFVIVVSFIAKER